MKRLGLLSLLVALFSSPAVHKTSYQQSVSLTSQYDLSIRISSDNHRIEVTGTCRLLPALAERNQIEFYLSPKMEGLKVQLLKPQASGPLNLQSNQEEGGDTKWVFKPMGWNI